MQESGGDGPVAGPPKLPEREAEVPGQLGGIEPRRVSVMAVVLFQHDPEEQ